MVLARGTSAPGQAGGALLRGELPLSTSLPSIGLANADRVARLADLGNAEVEHVAWSEDDRLLGVQSSSGLRLLQLEAGPPAKLSQVRVLSGAASPTNFSFRKGEDAVVTCNGEKKMSIWDIHSGWEKYELKKTDSPVVAVASLPAGGVVASSLDGTLLYWPAGELAKEPRSEKDHDGPSRALAVDAQGKYAATVGGTTALHVWKLPELSQIHEINLQRDKMFPLVRSVTLTPDGSMLWVGTYFEMRRWTLPAGKPEPDLALQSLGTGSGMFHPSGKLCIAQGEQGPYLASPADGKVLRKLFDARQQVAAAFQPESGRFLAVAADGKLQVHDVRSGARLCSEDLGRSCQLYAVAPGGDWLVCGADFQSLELFDLRKGGKGTRITGESGIELTDLVIDSKGKLLAGNTGGSGAIPIGKRSSLPAAQRRRVSLWQLEGKRWKRWGALDKDPQAPSTLAFSPDGAWLALGTHFTEPPQVRFLAVKSGALRSGVRLPLGRTGETQVGSLAFHPASKLLAAVVNSSSKVSVIDVDRSAVAYDLTIPGENFWTKSLEFDRSGKLLGVTTTNEIFVYSTASRGIVSRCKLDEGTLQDLAISPDGALLAAMSGRYLGAISTVSLILIERASGKELVKTPGHHGSQGKVSFSSDGKLLITASADGALRAWGIPAAVESKTDGAPSSPKTSGRDGAR